MNKLVTAHTLRNPTGSERDFRGNERESVPHRLKETVRMVIKESLKLDPIVK